MRDCSIGLSSGGSHYGIELLPLNGVISQGLIRFSVAIEQGTSELAMHSRGICRWQDI